MGTDRATKRVLKLRRGVSRLVGDAVLGWIGGSQIVAAMTVGILAPIHGWEWLAVGVIAPLAALAILWTYRLEGTRLRGGVFGLTFLDIDLSDASVRTETVPAGYLMTAELIVIHGAKVHRRWSLFDRASTDVVLGYGVWIGRKRRESWVREISSRIQRR